MVEKICFYGLMKEDYIVLFGKLCKCLGKKTVIVDKSKNEYLFMALSGNDQCDVYEFEKGRIFNNGLQIFNKKGFEQADLSEVEIILEYAGFEGISVEKNAKNVVFADSMPGSLHLFMTELQKLSDKANTFVVVREPEVTLSDEKYISSVLGISKEQCIFTGMSIKDYEVRKRLQNLREIKLKNLTKDTMGSLCTLGEFIGFGEARELMQIIKKEGKKAWGKLSFSGHRPPEVVA